MTETIAPSAVDRIREVMYLASKAILTIYECKLNTELTRKSDQSPLTQADLDSHRILSEGLGDILDFPILSEEGLYLSAAELGPTYWMIDPLDGTKDFLEKNGEFTINVSLQHGSNCDAGFIFVPVTNEFFWAQRNQGAFNFKGEKIVNLNKAPNAKIALCSRQHMSPADFSFLKEMNISESFACGSALKFCRLAEGRADVYFRSSPCFEWDSAAGQLICEEAGCSVIDLETITPLQYGKKDRLNGPFLASRGGITWDFERIKSLLNDY